MSNDARANAVALLADILLDAYNGEHERALTPEEARLGAEHALSSFIAVDPNLVIAVQQADAVVAAENGDANLVTMRRRNMAFLRDGSRAEIAAVYARLMLADAVLDAIR
jgi:hypothetical protein